MRPNGRHVFIGGRDRGLHWLERLMRRGQPPLAVYCLQEDDHEAEKHHPAVESLCQENGVACKVRKRLRAEDEAEIASLRLDLVVVMGWRALIGERVLSAPRFGAVGVHESLLPAYRGFAPVNWAVINGEAKTGVSLFHLTATGVDDGDVVARAETAIGEDDTAADVYRRTALASVELLEAHFDALLAGDAPRTPQDEGQATYTCARSPEDGLIDWRAPTRTIHNLVRGLAHPYPGARSYVSGKRYRIWSGEAVRAAKAYAGRIPGRVVGLVPGRGVEVLTGDGVYRVRTAGEEGQPGAPAETLFRSIRTTFSDRPAL
jgi:methionyl-tRNA formyltransferase